MSFDLKPFRPLEHFIYIYLKSGPTELFIFKYPVKVIYWIYSLLEWALFEPFTRPRLNGKAKYAQTLRSRALKGGMRLN